MDPHKDHKSHKDPNEEKDDQSSPKIIPEEDSEDEEAPDKELISFELKVIMCLSSTNLQFILEKTKSGWR